VVFKRLSWDGLVPMVKAALVTGVGAGGTRNRKSASLRSSVTSGWLFPPHGPCLVFMAVIASSGVTRSRESGAPHVSEVSIDIYLELDYIT
jgi:hypothetical protein